MPRLICPLSLDIILYYCRIMALHKGTTAVLILLEDDAGNNQSASCGELCDRSYRYVVNGER